MTTFVPTRTQFVSGLGIAVAGGAAFTLMHLYTAQHPATLRHEAEVAKVSASQPVEVTVDGQKVDSTGTTTLRTPEGGNATVTVSSSGHGNAPVPPASAPAVRAQVEVHSSSNTNGSTTTSNSSSSSIHSTSGGFTSNQSFSNVSVTGGGNAKVEVITNH